MKSLLHSLQQKSPTFWFRTILISFGLLFTMMAVSNHYLFKTFAYDYGAYNFGWRDFAHFKSSNSPIYFIKTRSFLQDHLSFTLIILAPLYWIMSAVTGTYSLLLIQTAFILWGGWATHRLVNRRATPFLANAALLMYFLSFGRFHSFMTDCNLMIILSSFVPVFLYYFDARKYVAASLTFLFLILGRESIPLWTMFISITLMIMYRKDRKQLYFAGAFLVISIIYFLLAFQVLIPAVENPEAPFNLFNYKALGADPGEALSFILSHPIDSILLMFENHLGDPKFDFIKVEWYIVYMVSGGLLLFYRPQYFLPFIPIVMGKMYNDSPIRWGIETYYSIEIVSVMPLFVALIIYEIKNIKWQKIIAVTACLSTVFMTIHKMDIQNRTSQIYSPDKVKPWDGRFYRSNKNAARSHELLKRIPDDVAVCATGRICAHLAFRDTINYFPRMDEGVKYLAFFQNDGHFRQSKADHYKQLNDYYFDPKYEVIADEYPLIILHESGEQSTEVTETPLFDDIALAKYQNDSLSNPHLTTSIQHPNVGDRFRATLWAKGNPLQFTAVLNTGKKTTEITPIAYGDPVNDWTEYGIDVCVHKPLESITFSVKGDDHLFEIRMPKLYTRDRVTPEN